MKTPDANNAADGRSDSNAGLGADMMTMCPKCVKENREIKHELRATHKSEIAECQHHGEMTYDEMFELLAVNTADSEKHNSQPESQAGGLAASPPALNNEGKL